MSQILSRSQLFEFIYSQRNYRSEAEQMYEIIKKHFGIGRDHKEMQIIQSNNTSMINIREDSRSGNGRFLEYSFSKPISVFSIFPKKTTGIDKTVTESSFSQNITNTDKKRTEKPNKEKKSKVEKKEKVEKKSKVEKKEKAEKKSKAEKKEKAEKKLKAEKKEKSSRKKDKKPTQDQSKKKDPLEATSPPKSAPNLSPVQFHTSQALLRKHQEVSVDEEDLIELLDLGCGTGYHLKALSKYQHLKLYGLDKEEEFLAQARINAPRTLDFYCQDMCNFFIEDKQFDVIVCMFSTIGYARNFDKMKQVLRNIRRHLREGGLVILEPWLFPADFHVGSVHSFFAETESIKLSRMHISKVQTELNEDQSEQLVSRLDFTYSLAVANAPQVEVFTETHLLGLWTKEQYIEAFQNSGIQVKYSAGKTTKVFTERGLFVGQDQTYPRQQIKCCKLVCTGDWTTQLNYLIERGWNIVKFLWETESTYRELDDYGKRLTDDPDQSAPPQFRKLAQGFGIGWYDVRTQCILLEREEELI